MWPTATCRVVLTPAQVLSEIRALVAGALQAPDALREELTSLAAATGMIPAPEAWLADEAAWGQAWAAVCKVRCGEGEEGAGGGAPHWRQTCPTRSARKKQCESGWAVPYWCAPLPRRCGPASGTTARG